MCVIKWDETLETGISTLDQQHRQLVDLMNLLHESMLNQTIDRTLSEVFSQLLIYFKEHFSYEESLFVKQYPRLLATQHKKEHQSFKDRVTIFNQRFKKDKTLLISLEIMNFLLNWLVSHIQNTDKTFAEFLKLNQI